MKNKKIFLTITMITVCFSSTAQQKSPYEGLGTKNDSILLHQLAREYNRALANRDTSRFGRLLSEHETEDNVMDYTHNDSFVYMGKKPLDKSDSSIIRNFFNQVNYLMDRNYSLNKLWRKSPGKIIFPAYKYIFKKTILSNANRRGFESNLEDSLHVYYYDAINFSKFENYCAKVSVWYVPGASVRKTGKGTNNIQYILPISFFEKEETKVGDLTVSGTRATLVVRDYKSVDKDIVNIYLNGILVRKNFIISGSDQVITLNLLPKKRNDIKIFVVSEGTHKPCTVEGYVKETKEKFSLYGLLGQELHLFIYAR